MQAELDRRLAELAHEHPLPASWGPPECLSFVTEVEGLKILLVGLVAKATARDGDVSGSAGALGEYPLSRAYFELVERASVIDALNDEVTHYATYDHRRDPLARVTRDMVFPSSPPGAPWTYSRSNGVAVAGEWEPACEAARAELIERHRVLASWFGLTRPIAVAVPVVDGLRALDFAYDVVAYEFPRDEWEEDTVHHTVGVFAFPRRSEAPLVFGLGAGSSLARAGLRAARELLQRLGFLWGEDIPTSEPTSEPTSAYHQEFYLWPHTHDTLRQWLKGERFEVVLGRTTQPPPASLPQFVDLTPPTLQGRLCVAKALPAGELPLTFGGGHPAFPEWEPMRSVHPIA